MLMDAGVVEAERIELSSLVCRTSVFPLDDAPA